MKQRWQARKYAKTNSACATDVRCNQKIKVHCVTRSDNTDYCLHQELLIVNMEGVGHHTVL
jgi:hypothetical protein